MSVAKMNLRNLRKKTIATQISQMMINRMKEDGIVVAYSLDKTTFSKASISLSLVAHDVTKRTVVWLSSYLLAGEDEVL